MDERELPPIQGDDLETIVEKISTDHGLDLRGYKRSTLYRRIRKRMSDVRCSSVEDYLVRLEADRSEYAQLINTILINVTEFFRDPAAWEFLQQECLRSMVRQRASTDAVRVWCAGCASGEEAYSAVICLMELADEHPFTFKVYATDLDEGALAVARAGIYEPDDLKQVSPERRERFFEEISGGRYRVRREVRTPVVFGRHNVLEDPPISRLDLLVCRNLLIYFDVRTQQQLLRWFHYALREAGILFLGKAETMMNRSELFRPVEPRFRIFRKTGYLESQGRLPAPAGRSPGAAAALADAPLPRTSLPIEHVVTPVVLLDRDTRIVAASPPARELFGIDERRLGEPLARLDEHRRPPALRVAIEDARTTGREVRVQDVSLRRPDGSGAIFLFHVSPLLDSRGEVERLVIWAEDRTRERELSTELSRTRQELETTCEELQTANEELETTNEELQSTNEELETTNEELQSTNEELETTIEELQSTNEELETANDELRMRQEELHERERFQRIILSSLGMGVIVVQKNFDVLSWNQSCEELWGLREPEVVGQNLFSLDTGMPFAALRPAVEAVVEGRERSTEATVEGVNRRGRRITCRVRVFALVEPPDGGAMIVVDDVRDA